MSRFTIGPWPVSESRPILGYGYVIATRGRPIIERRPSGTSTFMTYRTERRARMGLARVLPDIPDAEIVEVDRATGSVARPAPAYPSPAPLRVGRRALSLLRRLRRRA